MYVRTMMFEKTDAEKPFYIDGNQYWITNGSSVDMYNCRKALVEIYDALNDDAMEMNCAFDTYTTWRKDLITLLKEWDKCYVKHIKATYPEMSGHHTRAMQPLTDLVQANLEFYHLELMESNKKVYSNVPAFRH